MLGRQLSQMKLMDPPAMVWRDDSPSAPSREDSGCYFTFVKPGLRTWLELLGLDVTYTRACGNRLTYADPRGREIEVLDLIGGFGACLLGHNHPEILEVVTEHIGSLRPVLVQGSRQQEAGRLAARLSSLVAAYTGKVYVCTFGNSGAEAVEIAIKHGELERAVKVQARLKELRQEFDAVRKLLGKGLCRLKISDLHQVKTWPRSVPPESPAEALRIMEEHNGRVLNRAPLFLAVQGGFHGKTTGALSLTANPEYRRPFAALLQNSYFLDPAEPEALWAVAEASSEECYGLAVDETGEVRLTTTPVSTIAGLIAEPVQGEGGIHVLTAEFLQECRRLCDRLGVPLIFDEIQSGMGRTGRFLASEHAGVVADMYLLSKALGGGIAKVSATLIDRDRYQKEFSLIHSSTFAEDPLSAAVGNRVLDLIDRDGLFKLAAEKGSFLKGGLEEVAGQYPLAFEGVRGKGLMLGVILAHQEESPSPLIREIDKAGRLAHLACGYLLYREQVRLLPTLSDPHVLRLEPSAYISYSDLERVVEAFSRLGQVLTEGDARAFLGFVSRAPNHSAVAVGYGTNAPVRPSIPSSPTKVGFLIHFVDESQLEVLEPSFVGTSTRERERFIRALGPIARPIALNSTEITSHSGKRISFRLIAVPLTSRQMVESLQNPDASPASDMVREAAVLAKEMGCEVLGLGQYTSIVTKNGLALSDPGLAITTGNSLTVAMTLRAILKAARMRGLDSGHTSLAVVGAAGNIGSAYAALAARQFAPLTLVGSPRPGSRERLEAVRARIIQDIYGALAQEDAALPAGRGLARHLMELPLVRRLLGERAAPEAAFRAMASAGIVDELISVATDLSSIQTAKVIVAVSNSPDKVIRSEMVQEGAILCDVSVPCSTDQEVIETRRDVLFFTGGIVRLPKGERIEAPAFPLPPWHVFACMAETLVMGLSGIRESISCGAVDLAKIGLVETLARHHGFRLAGLRTDFLYPSELASGGGYHAVAQDAAMGRRNGDGNRDLRKG